MLGVRKKEIYGEETLSEINEYIAGSFGDVDFEFFQSNHEGGIVDKIQTTDADAAVINAGAYTHYSIAIRDAIESRDPLPFVEVHLSDVSRREEFRRTSYLTGVCRATYAGFGKESYIMGIRYLTGETQS